MSSSSVSGVDIPASPVIGSMRKGDGILFTQRHPAVIEVEDHRSGKELHSQEAAVLNTLELTHADRNVIISPSADSQLVGEQSLRHHIPVHVPRLLQSNVAISQHRRHLLLALIGEEQRAVSHVDDEVTLDADMRAVDVHGQHGVDDWHTELIKRQVHAISILRDLIQFIPADDPHHVISQVQVHRPLVVLSVSQHIEGYKQLVLAVGNHDVSIERCVPYTQLSVSLKDDIIQGRAEKEGGSTEPDLGG